MYVAYDLSHDDIWLHNLFLASTRQLCTFLRFLYTIRRDFAPCCSAYHDVRHIYKDKAYCRLL